MSKFENQQVGVVDIILTICFLPCLYFGLRNGLVRQIVSVCVIYFGITLSVKYAGNVSQWISSHISAIPETGTKLLSFILVFAVTAASFSFLGRIIEKIVKITLLGWLDKLLGVALSFSVFLLIISVIVYFVDSLNAVTGLIPADKIAESRLYPLLLEVAQSVFPLLKSLL